MTRRFVLRAAILTWLAVSTAAGLGVTSVYFKLRSSAFTPQGSRRLEGLRSNVRILTDSVGIPHIMAATELDAVRAQGFMHGVDRLWQMEFLRRTAAGRLSELFGERALGADRFVRTLGLWAAAEGAAISLDDAERARLEAYADGVNAAIQTQRGILPPEFVILGFQPEPWDATSTLAVGVVMNLDLSHWRHELSRFVGQRILPAEKYAYLHLPYPTWGPTILGGQPTAAPVAGSASGAVPASRSSASAKSTPASPLDAPEAGIDEWDPIEVLSSASIRVASNAWVIDGGRTESGHPILANDMHLSLRAPAIWYILALHAFEEDLHVAGFSLPGVPGIIVGYNRAVAWGFTNGMIDDMDFVIEELSPDGTAYREGDGWVMLEERLETIRVRERDEPISLIVRATSRGPLITDVLTDLDTPLSAMWVAAHDRMVTGGLWALGRTRSAREMDRAVRSFTAPHQNVVYATSGDRIGYRLGGSVPVRSGWSGEVPAPAAIVGSGWRGWWPAERHPAVIDPPAGFIATANNLQAPGLWDVLSADYPAPFRSRRITDLLVARDGWTAEDMYELQKDTRSLYAEMVLDRAIRAARDVGADSTAEALEGWDARVEIESREATVLFAWLYRLRELIAADEWTAAPARAFFPTAALLRTLAEGDISPWVDDISTPEVETIDVLASRAMVDALDASRGRAWGEVHTERNAHPLGSSSVLQWLFGFSIGPYPSAGGPNTVRPDNYARWDPLDSASWEPPYVNEYGPSERFVAELDPEGNRGWFLIPTGQSGNPFSRHYRDLSERWRAGDLVAVPLDSAAAVSRAVRQLSLTPPPRPAPADTAAAGDGGREEVE
jgi:penicillin amidase